MERIIAVIVSHNRHAQLVQAIEAIRQQTLPPTNILVVNNGSSDLTSVWLDKQEDIIQIYQDNKGSAGGYHAGISWAYENKYSWIWCMDDDSYPAADALQQLMAFRSSTTRLLNSAVLNKEDKFSFVWPTAGCENIGQVNTDCIEGEGFPFNGTLLHRDIIEKAGLPKPGLFYWGEEREYFYRIVNQHGISAVTVMASKHYHPPATYSHRSEWDYQTSWKMYFYVRNRLPVLQAKHNNKLVAFYQYAYFVAAFLWSIMKFQQESRFRKALFTFWPAMDAIRGKYTATPGLIIGRLNEKHQQSISALLFSPIKRALLTWLLPVQIDNSSPATS